tara:strand:- start:2597 stop:3001 length:405 start_codon:yes stop_codon:yes gene_type:complete
MLVSYKDRLEYIQNRHTWDDRTLLIFQVKCLTDKLSQTVAQMGLQSQIQVSLQLPPEGDVEIRMTASYGSVRILNPRHVESVGALLLMMSVQAFTEVDAPEHHWAHDIFVEAPSMLMELWVRDAVYRTYQEAGE